MKRMIFTKFKKVYYLLKPIFIKEKVELDFDKAKKNLSRYCPKPSGTTIGNNIISQNPNYDLQIIVPVYNVEKYLRECLDSIFSQDTQYSFKVIIINDGSTDSSLKIIEEYSDFDNVEIINQKNKGVSNARNQGLKYIDAKYLMFVDSDDSLEPNALENLLSTAISTGALYVNGSMYRFNEESKWPFFILKDVNNSHNENYINVFTCGGVYKSELFLKTIFPENYIFEDIMNIFLINNFISNSKAGYSSISKFVYNYRKNMNSLTHKVFQNYDGIYVYWCTDLVLKELELHNVCMSEQIELNIIKQIFESYDRTKHFSKNIKKDLFVVLIELFDKYVKHPNSIDIHRPMIKALINHDFVLYESYCKSKARYYIVS